MVEQTRWTINVDCFHTALVINDNVSITYIMNWETIKIMWPKYLVQISMCFRLLLVPGHVELQRSSNSGAEEEVKNEENQSLMEHIW